MKQAIVNEKEAWIPVADLPGMLPGSPHLRTIYNWIKNGINGRKLPSRRFGGKRFVHRDDLEAFFDDRFSS